jgi:hypothetical protein
VIKSQPSDQIKWLESAGACHSHGHAHTGLGGVFKIQNGERNLISLFSVLSLPFCLSLSLPKGSARVPAPPGAAGHRTGTQKNNPNQILNRSNPFFSSSKHVSESQNPNKKP